MKNLKFTLVAIIMAVFFFTTNAYSQTVGGLSADYPTLKAAFDDINAGNNSGDIVLQLIDNSVESETAVLYESGHGGTSSYTSVTIYPVASGLTISGFIVGPLISLNGADNVIIDGRVNLEGSKDMVITNTHHGDQTNPSSTIMLSESAENNLINYCIIKGSEVSTQSGIIVLSISTNGNGNDANTFDNNDITADDGDRPVNGIYSFGSLNYENSNNVFSNNDFYDCLSPVNNSNAINLNAYTTACNITGNDFYETSTFIPTNTYTYIAIFIQNTGSGFTITNNFIGGKAEACGGTVWTKTSSFDNIFYGIHINTSTGNANNIQGNTIKNISWSNAGAAAWYGIHIQAGDANIGTTTANTIGATTGTGSITVTGNATGTNFYGINLVGTGVVDCQNNTIGSVTIANAGINASSFYGINKVVGVGNTTISNNIIGSASTASSINASSTCTDNYAQVVIGVNSAGTGTIVINNNTIANLTNGTTRTSITTRGLINGITSSDGVNTISNNTIYNLTIANGNNASNQTASVSGIALTGNTYVKTVSGNTIYNLSNTYASFAGSIIGLYFLGNTGANVVSGNFINGLSVTGATSTAAKIYGIAIGAGATTYSNNVMSLGGNTKTTIYGIFETGTAGNNNNIYFNTIYIGGSIASGATNKSYALYGAVNTNTRNIRNNIFSNVRSTVAGANMHYAIYIISTGGSLTCDNNDYYVAGTGGTLGYYGGNKTALPIVTAQDANSWAINPVLANAGGTSASNYQIGEDLIGVSGLGIATDYVSTIRNNPTMGAFERPVNMWVGTVSTNWNIPTNWTGNAVPLIYANIIFDANPVNHCYLDQNRYVTNITNAQANYRMVTNGYKLTIRGDLNFTNGAQIDASATNSTVEYNGTDQTIINPNGVNPGYYNLILSNYGSKTMPGTPLLIASNLTLNGAVEVTGASAITIGGNLTIGTGTSFITGKNNHLVGGNFINNGTFTPSLGYSITLNGNSTQTISGTSASVFEDLILHNNNATNLTGISVNGVLSLEGTSTVTTSAPTYGSLATLQYKGSAAQTTGIELPATFVAGGGVIVNNSHGVSLGSSTTITNALTLTSGALTVNPSLNLTVGGTTNLGSAQCLILKSNASATASFIDNGFSGTGTAKVEKWVSSGTNEHWEYLSSPITAASSSIFTSPNRGLYWVKESQNIWVAITNSSAQNMPVLVGFGRKFVTSEGDGNGVKNFIGSPNTSSQTVPLTRTENAQGYHHGWNLVGNPYPSSIDWDAASGWTKTNISNAIYERHDGTISTYIDGIYTGVVPMTSIIPPMTSFWVRVDTGYSTGVLACNNNVRVHNHSVTPATPVNTLHLTVGNNSNLQVDDTYIRFKDYATDSFDGLYDAQKFYTADASVPQVYTRIAGFEDIAINTFGTLYGYRIIPLGFKTSVGGTFTITADMVSSLTASGYTVFLKDNETTIVQNLATDNTYEFTSGVTSGLNRFVVLLNPPITVFPAIALTSNSKTVFAGVSTVDFPYSATTNSPDKYSIDFDATAVAEGFSDVVDATLQTSQISISVPTGVSPGVYHGILTVKISANGGVSIDYPITIEFLTAFSITQNIGTTLLLNWSPTSGSSGYTIQYRILGSTIWNGMPSLNTNNVKIRNLIPGTQYECRVAVYKNGNVSYSQVGNFTTETVNYTKEQDMGTTLQLSWSNITWASYYTYSYRKVGTSVWTGITSSTNLLKLCNLTPETNYECRVSVYTNGSLWGIAQTGTFTTGKVEFSASSITANSLTLSWPDMAPWASTYTIQYRTQAGPGTWIGQPAYSNHSVNISNLTPATTYECRVYVYKNFLWGVSQIGTFSTANNKALNITNENNSTSDFNVYPNPFNAQVNIDLFSEQETKINWKVYDMTGRLVLCGNESVTSGFNTLNIDAAGLPGGVYMLNADMNGRLESFRLLKQ